MSEPQTLTSGLAIGESPRCHGGRLWFSNWGTQEIVAVDLEGNGEVMARVPTTVPFCIDWLPDGRMLVVSGPEALLLRREPDGSLVTHADLGGLAEGFNEIVADGRGNALSIARPGRSWSGVAEANEGGLVRKITASEPASADGVTGSPEKPINGCWAPRGQE